MTSKRRKSCKDKQRHETEAEAQRHADALKRSFPKTERRIAYPCKYCHGWHVGRKKKNS